MLRTLNARTLTLLFFGLASAIPVVMSGTTLTVRFAELGLTKTMIGYFGLLHLPYSFRLFWGPLMDHNPCPWLSFLGWRKAWTILSLIATTLCIAMLGWLDPVAYPVSFACVLGATSLASGVVYMAGLSYELESLNREEYAVGSACVNAGYRMGLLIGGAGALYIATFYGWPSAYLFASAVMAFGIIGILFQPEPQWSEKLRAERFKSSSWLLVFLKGLIEPIVSFYKRPESLFIVLFIVLYKLGDDFAHGYLPTFFLEIGFSKTDIALAVKMFGMGATFVGVVLGGFAAQKFGSSYSLFLFGSVHALCYVGYMILYYAGPSLPLLCGAVAFEHVTSGMVITTFIAYLWSVADSRFAAMQYALFWSLLSMKHVFMHAVGGFFADRLSWSEFFGVATALFIPGLLLLLVLQSKKEKLATHT